MPAESKPRESRLPRSLKLLGVAALFAVSAALSAVIIALATGLIGRVLMPKLPHGGL